MIRFVYLDMGNVLIGFSHQRAAEQLGVIASLPAADVYARLFQTQLQIDYESGKLDTSEFCNRLRDVLAVAAPDEALIRATCDIFWPMYRTIPVVAGLVSAGIPLGVLSNTCESHWNWVTTRTMPWMQTAFGTFVLSYQVGAAKPGPEIYRHAIEAAGVQAGEIFFADDRPENVEAARSAGIRASLFTGANSLAADLRWSGVEFNY